MANRNDANTSIIENSQLAMHLGELMATQGAWEGNSKELLSKLNKLADESTRKSRRWPETPRKLSGDLRRMAQSLRTPDSISTSAIGQVPADRGGSSESGGS